MTFGNMEHCNASSCLLLVGLLKGNIIHKFLAKAFVYFVVVSVDVDVLVEIIHIQRKNTANNNNNNNNNKTNYSKYANISLLFD